MGGVVNQEAGNSCKGGCLQQEMRAQICTTMCVCVDTYEYTTYSPELLWSGRFRREQAQQADLIQGLLVGRRIATSCKGRRKDRDNRAFWEANFLDNRCSPQVACRLHACMRCFV